MADNLLERNMPSFLKENEARKSRWAHLTEGLDDYDRLAVETIMDNTQIWINETSTTANVGNFTTYAFPLIRRTFPNLIAKELVSVQPIPMPTAKIFYFDFKYGSDFAGQAAGENTFDLGKHNPYYAGGKLRQCPVGTGDGTQTDFQVAIYPLVANSEIIYVDAQEQVGGYTLNADTGELAFDVAPAADAVITIDAQVTPAEGGKPREVEWDMSSDSVDAETEKLLAKWTLEGQQDLMAYHGLSAEDELLGEMGDQIQRNINTLILQDLVRNATAGNVNWSKTMPVDYDGTLKEYKATIFERIIDANNLIYNKRFRNATWIVADPDTCSLLEKVDGFKEVKDSWTGGAAMGVEQFGIINNRFKVYKDPLFQSNTMLLGHKGSRFFETGYVYAPYVPFYVTPTITDPQDFTPRRGVMSRFARKPVITDFYSTVTIGA